MCHAQKSQTFSERDCHVMLVNPLMSKQSPNISAFPDQPHMFKTFTAMTAMTSSTTRVLRQIRRCGVCEDGTNWSTRSNAAGMQQMAPVGTLGRSTGALSNAHNEQFCNCSETVGKSIPRCWTTMRSEKHIPNPDSWHQ